MNTKSKRKHKSHLPHFSIAFIILVIVLLVGLVYLLQLNGEKKALAGEAIQLSKAYVSPPQNQIISAEALKSSGAILQSEFELKVKQVIKNSLSFRNAEKGLSCQQTCQKAPGAVGNLYGTKLTSQCVGVVASGFAATAEKVILASSDKVYQTNGFIQFCEKVINQVEDGGTLCLCI